MFQEFRDFLTITLAKRLSSPFLGTFIFTWAVVNIDMVLLVFSNVPWDVQQANITSYYTKFEWYRLVLPLLITGFYVFIWPYLDMYIFKFTKELNFKFKELQIKLEGEQPISKDELDTLRASHKADKKAYDADIEAHEKTIKQLKDEVKELESRPTQEAFDKLTAERDSRPTQEAFNNIQVELKERPSINAYNDLKNEYSQAADDAKANKSGWDEEVKLHENLKQERKKENDQLSKLMAEVEQLKNSNTELQNNLKDSQIDWLNTVNNELKSEKAAFTIDFDESGVLVSKPTHDETNREDIHYNYSYKLDSDLVKLILSKKKTVPKPEIRFTQKDIPDHIWEYFTNVHFNRLSNTLPTDGALIGSNQFDFQMKEDLDSWDAYSVLEHWYSTEQSNDPAPMKNKSTIQNKYNSSLVSKNVKKDRNHEKLTDSSDTKSKESE
ncbi:hypothetical protein [Pseudoalteromonas sp. Of7M-16]|uniref:hypothetical protein n=1 Tax=Pseudoalteromonas sp. Of7M-16 TaxID=2917756 RepID=UPI001EF5B365|nr:hypothetical protein [Pseudoalteromonas sp. Of7M-16]MCG7550465.1 hypothetical protein [Pseudoalteromonas sp. Of7M-16]